MCYINTDLGLGIREVQKQMMSAGEIKVETKKQCYVVDLEKVKRDLEKAEVENLELITKYNSVIVELSHLKRLIARVDPIAIRDAIAK